MFFITKIMYNRKNPVFLSCDNNLFSKSDNSNYYFLTNTLLLKTFSLPLLLTLCKTPKYNCKNELDIKNQIIVFDNLTNQLLLPIFNKNKSNVVNSLYLINSSIVYNADDSNINNSPSRFKFLNIFTCCFSPFFNCFQKTTTHIWTHNGLLIIHLIV